MAAYHASRQEVTRFQLRREVKIPQQFLQLFYKKSTTAAIIKHGMNINHQLTGYHNYYTALTYLIYPWRVAGCFGHQQSDALINK